MDISRWHGIPADDLGCGGPGATTVERALATTDRVLHVQPAEIDALVLDRSGEQARHPVGFFVEA